MLQDARERERSEDKWSHQALKRLSQLPGLVGAALDFVWDVECLGDDTYSVIKVGEQSVWRELSHLEDSERFNQVKRLLKKKYGRRFSHLTATDAAAGTLLAGSSLATLTPT